MLVDAVTVAMTSCETIETGGPGIYERDIVRANLPQRFQAGPQPATPWEVNMERLIGEWRLVTSWIETGSYEDTLGKSSGYPGCTLWQC